MKRRKSSAGLLYETVVEHIREKLLSGSLSAGAQLPTVTAMAEQLGVGQAAVREAYRLLESKGVLEVTQGRGTFVSNHLIDINAALDSFRLIEQPSRVHLLEARRLLEPGIAALAAVRATPSEVETIVKLAHVSDSPRPSQEVFTEINIEFHDAIATAAHNPVLKQMLSAIHDLMRNSRPHVDDYLENAIEKAMSAHRLIAYAIREHDADAARVLMYQHIRSMEERLLLATTDSIEPDYTTPKSTPL